VLLVGGRSRFFQDPGTFWHVATGDRILDEGFIDTDPYTFTFHGTEWIPYQWLGECAMSIGNRIGGFDMLLLGTVTLLAAVYTGIGMRLLRAGFHPSVVAVIVAAGVAASSGHFHVRPLIVTIACMAILGVYLSDVENGIIRIERLVWLVPVFWLWANIHGGVMGGLATFALAIAGWTALRIVKAPSPIADRRAFVRVFTIWLACVAVCFAGPYLHRLPKTWIYLYQMPNLPSIIEEHGPMDLGDWVGIAVLVFGVLYCLLLLSVPVRKVRVTWLLPLVWFALSFMRVRHAPLFAVLALVAVADFFPYTRLAATLVRKGSDLFSPRPSDEPPTVRESAMPFLVPAILVVFVALLQAAGVGRGWAKLDPKIWPIELLPELRAHQYDRPSGTRIFCEYHFGGYLIYETPGYRVFIDDRCEVFGDAFLVQFVMAKQLGPASAIDSWDKQYGPFDLALVQTGGGFDKGLEQLQPLWTLVKRTDTATLYKKATAADPTK
jgi:hypothetical protein